MGSIFNLSSPALDKIGADSTEVRYDIEELADLNYQELIFQPANRWKDLTGHYAEIEMGEFKADSTVKVQLLGRQEKGLADPSY